MATSCSRRLTRSSPPSTGARSTSPGPTRSCAARRYELGAGIGAHAIQGESDERVWARGVHESLTGASPFATVALDGTWLISQRFSFNARAQYLSLNYNSNSGTLGDYHADVQFRWRPNLAFGIGYESTHERVIVRNKNPNGDITFNTHGAELFVRASF